MCPYVWVSVWMGVCPSRSHELRLEREQMANVARLQLIQQMKVHTIGGGQSPGQSHSSARQHWPVRWTSIAPVAVFLGRTLLPWLCLLAVASSIALALQLIAGAMQPQAGTAAGCDEISHHLAPDVAVAMTTEDLKYLQATLCTDPLVVPASG